MMYILNCMAVNTCMWSHYVSCRFYACPHLMFRVLICHLCLGFCQCKVRFVDFGNTEEKHWSDLVELPSNLATVKPFASKYALQGVVPAHANNEQQFSEVSEQSVNP